MARFYNLNGNALENVVVSRNFVASRRSRGWQIQDRTLGSLIWSWFFVASYVVMDSNKLSERDVDNDIPHGEG